MSSVLTNTDNKNRPVPEKKLDALSLFKSLVFLQIKASLLFHGWFKNVCNSNCVFCHELGPEVSRFTAAVIES